MKKLTILIDMDDVLDNLLEVWIEELNSLYGTSVEPEQVTDWNLASYFPEISKKSITMPLFRNYFWERVKPQCNAVEVTEKLQKDGHELYVVTASYPESINAKLHRFFFRYFPHIKYDHIIITSKKQMVYGDVLIDDAVHNLIGGQYRGILYRAPHNEAFDAEQNGLIRANDWNDIYKIICRIAQED